MSDIIVSNNNSPFDSIRHIDEDNNEFWYARELMGLLGYPRWQTFINPIKQAIENLELANDDPANHFSLLTVKTSGRKASDYKLSRYGCYMAALCCDGRKSEVALAKKYFAIKTREAEIVIPQQNERLAIAQLEIEKLKLENENLKLKTNYMERRDTIRQLHGASMLALLDGRPDAVVEKIERVTESIICKNGKTVSFEGKSTAQVGKELGFKTGKEFERWLEKIGRDDLICQGLRINQAPYIPTENIAEVKQVFVENRTKNRQMLLGE